MAGSGEGTPIVPVSPTPGETVIANNRLRPAGYDADYVAMAQEDLFNVIEERGWVGTYRKASGVERQVHFLPDEDAAQMETNPRGQRAPMRIKVVNEAVAYYGITVAEWAATDVVVILDAEGTAIQTVRLAKIVERSDIKVVFEA
jgi:hypothetical protein